jgi:hypothetical protein
VTIMTDLDLPVFSCTASDLAADAYQQRQASPRKHGWLPCFPLGFVALDREAGELFLRSKSHSSGTARCTGPFDITASREDNLLTFGKGPHHCLGLHAARAQMEEALKFLAPRMPGLALDGDPKFSLGGVNGMYDAKALPLRWNVSG